MATEKKPEPDELIHIGPEMAVAEADVHAGGDGRVCARHVAVARCVASSAEKQARGFWAGRGSHRYDRFDCRTDSDQARLWFHA